MASFYSFRLLVTSSAVLVLSMSTVINGQISTPCTMSMIISFTPCFNYITGSSSNGSSSPTTACCDILRSLMNTSMDCACLLLTANVPLPPIVNPTLAMFLPRACNMRGVPLQCKASVSSLPAPGPIAFGPTGLSTAGPASPLSPRASKAVTVPQAMKPETSSQLTPAEAPIEGDTPTVARGKRPVLVPSSSNRTYVTLMSTFLVLFIGFVISKAF